MAIFLKYGSIKGETTQQAHKDWIEINSMQFGMGRSITASQGGASKRESTAPSISEIVLTKSMDISSPLLFKEALGGKAVEVKIELTQTDNNGKHIPYQKYVLSDAVIASYSISSGGDRPMESLSLNFMKVDSEYLNIDDKFASKTTGHVVYDVGEQKLT
ncbi:Hcp family type VI secretion system effector [Roseococcus sp. YIM B11640]|uniref:Hcp family type VI secretion system effector n=1 Tax=Roseococcus sp. YIM B11640 TaxID=3133973 RepID=UPI003C7A4E21